MSTRKDLELGRGVSVKNIHGAMDLTLPHTVREETKVTEQGMRRIASRNRYTGGRLGRGEIQVLIEGLNGDVRILERKA